MKKLHFVRTTILASTLLLQLSHFCLHSHAAPGDVDLSFDPGSGVNGSVHAIVVQPDGRSIIGGNFTTVKALVRYGLARLNADGSGDSTFNPSGSYGIVAPSLALQPEGKVLVGHYYGIDRLHFDGSVDTGFNATTTTIREEDGQVFPAPVNAIAIQSDGKLLVGGDFTVVNGTNRMRVARLNANGSLDTSFDPGTALHQNVTSVVLQPDGKVLIGGDFSTTNGIGIARLNSNGSLDTSFNPGIDAYGVRSVALQPDGKLLIGGIFAFAQGTNESFGIARLNANGSPDPNFNAGSGAYDVTAIALQSDGKVLLSGAFTNVNGTSRSRIARLHANGSVDASFDPNPGASDTVHALALRSDGKVMIGGGFNTVNGVACGRVAQLNSDGTLDGGFESGSGGDHYSVIRSVVTDPNGKVLIGGSFSRIQGLGRNGIARLHTNASGDSTFNPGTGADNEVLAVVAQPDGKVLIGGSFTAVNGTNRLAFARLNTDGNLDITFTPDIIALVPHEPIGTEHSTAVTTVLLQPDGKILVAGYHQNLITDEEVFVPGIRYFIVRFLANGSSDPAFTPFVGEPADGAPYWFYGWSSYPVSAVAVQSDGKIILSGDRNSVNNTNFTGIARLNADGTRDNSFTPGIGMYAWVTSLEIQPDDKLLMAGSFGIVSGTNRSGICRLQVNGSLDNTFNPIIGPNASVSSFALQPDGKVVIGGSFTNISGTNLTEIARLNSDGSLDSSFNPGAASGIRSLTLQPDGKVLIGGGFLTVNGVLRPYVARLHGDSIIVPSLEITGSSSFLTISWPASATGFTLQETTNLLLVNSWSAISQTATTNGAQISVSIPASGPQKFFRLNSP